MAENKESRWWICPKCEHEVLANDRPTSIKWTDGHVCHFVEKKEEDRENES
jgi:ribosomal protein L24E